MATKKNLRKESEFEKELCALINRHSKENDSNTPDFILAEYLQGCLENFGVAMKSRDKFFGRTKRGNGVIWVSE